MYNSLHRYLVITLSLSVVILCYLEIFSKNPVWLAVCVTVIIMNLIMLALTYKVYHDGTGRPREISRMPFDIPHKIEFEATLGSCPIVGLRPYTISYEHRVILPQKKVIIYRGVVPGPRDSHDRTNYVMMTLEDGFKPELNRWYLDGFKVHE